MKKKIIILGGGVGGVAAAKGLSKINDKADIVLIDRSKDHVFSSSLLWVVSGRRKADEVKKPLSRLSRRGICVVNGDVVEIDPARGVVTAREPAAGSGDGLKEYGFDYLVVALGAEPRPGSLGNFREAAIDFTNPEGAEELNGKLGGFKGGRVAILVSSLPYRCPGAPCELAMIIEHNLRKRGLAGNSEVAIYTPEPFPLPVTGEKMGMAVRGMLEKRGIRYFENHKVTGIDPAKKEMTFENGKAYGYDLLAGIPPHSAPDAVRNSRLADQSSYIPVDRHTLRTEYENIYAIGDVAKIAIAGGKALPKAGVFAHIQGEVVAGRIIASIEGRNTEKKFKGHGSCVLETGGSGAGFAKGNFFAEPAPAVRMYPPFFGWHLAKIMLEKWWFIRYF